MTDKKNFIINYFNRKIWDKLILFCVLLVLIILYFELTKDLTEYEFYLALFEMIITLLFVIDLTILYYDVKNWKNFFKKNWMDIIATIPLGQFFRLAKILRAARIIKSFKLLKMIESVKVIHLDRAMKVFSKKDRTGKAKLKN